MKIDFINELELQSTRLILKVLNTTFTGKILEYYRNNKNFFVDIDSIVNDEFYSSEYQEELIWQEYSLMVNDRAVIFYIFEKNDILYDNILGDVSIFNIVRGNNQSCSLGFKLDKNQTGKGYMQEALTTAIDYAFATLELHRIEAYILAENKNAIKTIEKLEFIKEGTANDYAFLNGKWHDYLRYVKFKR